MYKNVLAQNSEKNDLAEIFDLTAKMDGRAICGTFLKVQVV